MKCCVVCKVEKPLDEFPFLVKRNTYMPKCKLCKQAYDRAYWQKTKAKRDSQKKKNIVCIRERNTKYLLEYLNTHPCVLCNETDPLVLEFDHLDPKAKLANVSELLGFSISRIKLEISKCRVLCANCHRRETAKQFQYMMWKLINGV